MEQFVKTLSVALIILLVINVTLFALGKITTLMMWLVIAICAALAFKGVPYLNSQK